MEFGVVGKSMSECSSGGVVCRELLVVARPSSSSEWKSWMFMHSRPGGLGGALLGLRRSGVVVGSRSRQ